MRRKIIFLCLAIGMAFTFCEAQVPSLNPNNGIVPAIMNSAGGTYDNASSYFRFEWSIGELVLVQSFAPPDSSILVTQGVLQPCTDQVALSPYTTIFTEGEYRVFPNPTGGKFELDFFVKQTGTMNLQLVNSMGQVLQSKTYHYDGCCRIELFDITRMPNGVYFIVADLKPDTNRPGDNIQIIRHNGFKVIKINEK